MRIACIYIINLLMPLMLSAQDNMLADTVSLLVSKYGGLPEDATVYKLDITKDGIFWAATSLGLYVVDQGRNSSIKMLDVPNVTDIATDNQKNQWASAGNKLYNLASKEIIEMSNDGEIVDIAYFNTDIWIGTTKGLFTYKPKTGKLTHYHSNNSDLNSNKINFVHSDKNGIVWIGTDSGYVRIEGDKWEDQDKGQKMISTAENDEGQWIVTEDDMFLINKYNRLFPVGLDGSLFKGKINAITFDKNGRIYITSDIAVRYNPYEELIEDFTKEAGIVSSKGLSILRDENQNVWIGTEGDGLHRLQFSDIAGNLLSVSCVLDTPPTCFGQSEASINVVVSGGIPPYSYKWNNEMFSGSTLSELSGGRYEVTVTDNSGVSSISSISIKDPEELKITDIVATKLSGAGINDATIQIVSIGGTGSHKYEWNNGENKSRINKLSGGKYTVTVTDKNGCSYVASTTIEKIKLLPELTLENLAVGKTLRLEQLYFDADSTVLKIDNFPILDEVFDFLVSHNNIVIEIGGHTNTIPSTEYCDKLSNDRAENVANYLYNKGITKERLSYKGYGKRLPITTDRSLAGRKRNQRVEIKVISI